MFFVFANPDIMSKVNLLAAFANCCFYPMVAASYAVRLSRSVLHEYRKPSYPGLERQISYTKIALHTSIFSIGVIGTMQGWSGKFRGKPWLTMAGNLTLLPFVGTSVWEAHLLAERNKGIVVRKEKYVESDRMVSRKHSTFIGPSIYGPVVHNATITKSKPIILSDQKQ